jgi:hypothetical protein
MLKRLLHTFLRVVVGFLPAIVYHFLLEIYP